MKLKICGINHLEVLSHLVNLKVHYLGFIYFENSPRAISRQFLCDVNILDLKDSTPVVVLVNPTASKVDEVLNAMPEAILQFHGDESDKFCSQFGVNYWKSVSIQNLESLTALEDFPKAHKILLETYSAAQYGGSGSTFDWSLIASLNLEERFVLAGGINAKNIKDAIALNPWCIDVNSGVESDIAVKDKDLITNITEIFHEK